MISALHTAVALVLYLWALWYVYILVMGLYRAHLDKKLTRWTYAMAVPALFVGYLMDWLANWVIASFVFAEPPDTFLELVTDRLQRYMRGPAGWRQRRAQWVCDHLLDYFDPRGSHCK